MTLEIAFDFKHIKLLAATGFVTLACDGPGRPSAAHADAGYRSFDTSSSNVPAEHSRGERRDAGSGDPATSFTSGSVDASAGDETEVVGQRDALGPYPFIPSPVTLGGTMTFLNVGAPGFWPRRLERNAGDPACNYKDGSDTWGGHCCLEEHHTASDDISPFDEEMVLILKAINVKQLAVYQPSGSQASSAWLRVTSWDSRTAQAEDLWFTQRGEGSARFPGDLTHDDCVGYLSRAALLECDDLPGYYCPSDAGVMHQGFTGSKLFVFLASMTFDDTKVQKCEGEGAGHPGPWVALVASELVRDGGRKWNGACNCYSQTGSVGDGCGEMNVFEVVLDGNEFSNREFMSTGVRSYQAGHVGGSVCGAGCEREAFGHDVELVDACALKAYTQAPSLTVGGEATGCPVWRRPEGDRYFLLLLDEQTRTIQVAVVHPDNIDFTLSGLLPALPSALERVDIDALSKLRLPQ